MVRTALIAVLMTLIGCGPSSTRLEDHKQLAESLQAAENLEFYEGLPHQHFEPQLIKEELASKLTTTFGGFPFYAAPLDLAEEDSTALTDLFCKEDSFVPLDLTSAKACGGFHPDYCIVWEVGPHTYFALLCFGCQEVKSSGNGLELHAEFSKSTLDALKLALQHYQKNRPSRQP